ncbi:hypothetical protein N7540_000661 [Penicillium herquei]|nr:hypothetical protein N7540_000661 [Penicillium herquei]
MTMSFENYSSDNEPLMSGEDGLLEEQTEKRFSNSSRNFLPWKILFGIVGSLFIFGLGVVTGKSLPARNEVESGLLAPEGDVKVLMEYNSTFSIHPSPETEAAWESLFPKGKGFVRHETIAPETSGLAVYHALHCVKSLHDVYYTALDGSHSEDMANEHSHLNDPHHVRHCFDYLRQSLMCAADTNLEPISRELKGVTGWGFTRTCRNLESVKLWAEANWSNDID